MEKSFIVPYKPTEEELAKGEREKFFRMFCKDWHFLADDYENVQYFPWASWNAYSKYVEKNHGIAPSIDRLIDTLKNADFTTYNSLAKVSILMCRFHEANLPIPFGTYKSQAYNIRFCNDLYGTADSDIESETDGINVVVGQCYDHRATWLMRLDILHSVDNPVLVFSAPIIPFGTLEPINDNSEDPDMVFRLVINAIDSSLWLVYEFKRYTDVGCDKYIIGEGDEWGKLAPDDVPFTAARIADSVADCGIGKADWPIPLPPPQSRICGGPGTLRAYEVDDNFLQKTIPAPSSACTRPPKNPNLQPPPRPCVIR